MINAGRAGDAWSGGDAWRDPEVISEVTRFVYEGGCLIGIGEPSAAEGGDTRFTLAHLLGVDRDDGAYACHAPWEFTEETASFFIAGECIGKTEGIRLTDPDTQVLRTCEGTPVLTLHSFGRGKAVYMGGFTYAPVAARMLLEMLLYLTGKDGSTAGMTDQTQAECAWYPESETLVVMNNGRCPLGN